MARGIYTHAVELNNVPAQSEEGLPLHGDRGVWDVLDYPDEHARDISDGTFEYHNNPSGITRRRMIYMTAEGDLIVSTNPIVIPNHLGGALTILGVYLDVTDAPAGDDIIVDIHKDGVTIFTVQANRPVITDGNTSGNTTTIDVSSWADGEVLQMEIDNVGSGTAGSNLTVTIVAE